MTCRAVLGRSIILLPVLLAFAQPLEAQKTQRYAPGHWVVTFTAPQSVSLVVRDVTGGNAVGQVVTSQKSADGSQQKHLGSITYEPVTFSIPAAEAGKLLQDLLSAKVSQFSGSVTAADFNWQAVRTTTFNGAVPTRIALPTLDASSKDAAFIQVELTAGETHVSEGDKSDMRGAVSAKQKSSLVSAFRAELDGLPSNRISKIEGIAVQRKIAGANMGARRDYQVQPAELDISDLTVTFSQVDAKQWQQWFDDFVVKGDNGPDREKTLTVELLAPDMKQSLLILRAKGVGIYALRPAATSPGTEGIARMEAKLYVEGWEVVSSGVAAR